MHNLYLRIAALNGALAVALGAFGTHALRDQLTARIFDAYQTGVLYHFIHTLLLVLVSMLMQHNASVWIRRSAMLLVAGLLLFSGSLYTMAFLHVAGFEFASKLGIITPLGGGAFIAAWFALFLGLQKQNA